MFGLFFPYGRKLDAASLRLRLPFLQAELRKLFHHSGARATCHLTSVECARHCSIKRPEIADGISLLTLALDSFTTFLLLILGKWTARNLTRTHPKRFFNSHASLRVK
jgi:hypothetical protein